jgi:hypothetical protein
MPRPVFFAASATVAFGDADHHELEPIAERLKRTRESNLDCTARIIPRGLLYSLIAEFSAFSFAETAATDPLRLCSHDKLRPFTIVDL